MSDFLINALAILSLVYASLLLVDAIVKRLPRVRERRRRERVAKLRAEAASCEARAILMQYNLNKGATVPTSMVEDMQRDYARAAEARALANHYAENDAP